MSATTFDPPARCWAEIDLGVLRANARAAQEAAGRDVGLMAVVKANAYGHGLETVSRALDGFVTFFGVANAQEAARLSAAGIRSRIYLLGASYPDERESIVRGRWTPCLSSLEEARAFSSLSMTLLPSGETLPVHLAADTGMGRGGFLPEALLAALPELLSLPGLDIEGLGSHLPSPDEDREFTISQNALFAALVASSRQAGADLQHIHLANSAGLLDYECDVCTLARPGLALYGVSPLPEYSRLLQPVLALKARVILTRTLPAGHGISYGRTTVLQRPTPVATIAIGYGDGYPRHLSGRDAHVLIRGERCPVLGRVTMDQIMVDTTPAGGSVQTGDEAVLIGSQGSEIITAEEIARKADTIPWEIFTRITQRVERQTLEASGETA